MRLRYARGPGLNRRSTLRGVFFASAVVAQSAFATGTQAQSLDDVQNWSLRSSAGIQADNARQDATVSRLRGSVDAFMPTVAYVQERIVDSKISYSPEIIVPTEAGLDSTIRRQPNAYGFQASLSLFDGFKRYNNFRSASLGVESGKFLQIEKRQQTLLDASTAYLAIIRDRKIVELRRRQVADIIAISARTKARYSVRDATLTDVDLSESRVLAARVALEQSMADLTSSNIEFTRLTGVEPTTLADPHVPNASIPATVEELQASLIQSNPRLNAARLDATAAGYVAKAQFAEIMPQVNLIGSHYRQSNISQALSTATDSTIKVQMRVPLYEPGAIDRINETAALARQRSWDVVDGQKASTAAISSAFYTRLSTIAQVGRTNARVKAMQKAVDGYRIEQSAGFRTIIDILNARNELTDAQVAKVFLEFSRDRQTFALAAALARLGTPDQAGLGPTPSLTMASLAHPANASITKVQTEPRAEAPVTPGKPLRLTTAPVAEKVVSRPQAAIDLGKFRVSSAN